jgi:outer membrane protein assembly factor BamB/tetratricopeptide (TPR) repeat protein
MRVRVILGVLLACAAFYSPAGAQILSPDRRAGQMLTAAAEYIAAQDYKTAVRLIQHLLDSPEEAVAPLKRKGGEALVGVRTEAERLLREMPAAGRDVYEAAVGPAAAELLKRGRALGDMEMLAAVVRRYLYTAAGPEALHELARAEFRGGHHLHAAFRYEQLLARRPTARWTTEDLYQAAVACRKAGLKATAAAVAEPLLERARDGGVHVDGWLMDGKALRAAFEKLGPAVVDGASVFRVNAERTNQLPGGPAFLEARWRAPMLRSDVAGPTFQTIQKAEKILRGLKQPILPAFFPVTATVERDHVRKPLLIYKNFWGVHAVDMRTGRLEWDSGSTWSLEKMLAGRDARKLQALNQWLNVYVEGRQRPALLFENANFGTLSTDNQFVYVVEDFLVPPLPQNAAAFNPGFPEPLANTYSADINDAIHHNRLQAYNLLKSGKLEWEVGSVGERHELSDSFFLGPPLPLDGRLYVLTEKQQMLRLVCLDPHGGGKVVSVHTLGKADQKYQDDVYNRRSQAVHLASGEGVLVVPTNAGTILGLRLVDGSLAWSFAYRDKAPADEQPMAPWGPGVMRRGIVIGPDGRPIEPPSMVPRQWKTSAPAIRDGKVVFTAPDGRSLYCLRLADGTRVWANKRLDDDLYFAGIYAGKALVVGKKRCRAVNLDTGEVAWELDTGLPSGQGVASGNIYFLPLRESGPDRQPEIAAIDVARGIIVAHTRSSTRDVPGNLLFFEGDVVSQSAKDVTAYPQLKVKIAWMDEKIAKNPNDPDGLAERGELRLNQGDVRGAIEDLRRALANKPADEVRGRVRLKLYQAMTHFVRDDFDKAEEYLKEYEDLVNQLDGVGPEARAEARQRRVQFLMLVGRGREGQAKLVEALQAYLDLAGLETGDTMVPLPGDRGLKVRIDVWARGRIEELLKKADAPQRKRLQEEIDKHKKREGADSKEGLRHLAALFGPHSAEGRRIRLALARQLLEDAPSQVEADLLLQQVRHQTADTAQAAEAVELLAQLARRRGLLADAGYYYRLLGRDFARTTLPGGKTGAEILQGEADDKRMLPYLEEHRPAWPQRMRAVLEDGTPADQILYLLRHAGEPLPLFGNLEVGVSARQLAGLVLRDRRTAEERWAPRDLPGASFQGFRNAANVANARRLPYFSVGHLVVLPVGPRVFGFDPVGKRVLWEKDVLGQDDGLPANPAVQVDAQDGTLRLLYPDGTMQRLGGPAVLDPAVFVVLTRAGLEGIDPATGRTLWQRTDVSPNTDFFGDGSVVALVENDSDGTVRGTRILNTADGTVRNAPGFAAAYAGRLRTAGRRLLVSEATAALTLRFYDVVTGGDVWKHSFPAGSKALQAIDLSLAGAAAPDGTLTVVDLETGKSILDTCLADAGWKDAEAIHLLADADLVYVAVRNPRDPSVARLGGVMADVLPATGLFGLEVNGPVHAVDRATGGRRWTATPANQCLLLDRLAELPVLILAARRSTLDVRDGTRMRIVVALEVLDKRTGKLRYRGDGDGSVPYQFHTLRVDPAAGRVELLGVRKSLVLQPTEEPKR